MSLTIKADLVKTLGAVAAACDLVDLRLQNHGERVAYIALQIGIHWGLDKDRLKRLALSSLIHDIGIVSTQEKLELADFQPPGELVSHHARRGHDLLVKTRFFKDLAQPVLEHHNNYTEEMDELGAIIHLADRVENLLKRNEYVLWQVDTILQRIIKHRGTTFHPDVVDCFVDLAQKPSLWLDLHTGNYAHALRSDPDMTETLGIDELEDIAELFATIVDSKSPFTACHSSGLAAKTKTMAQVLGYDKEHVRQLRVAALLHDIGKLAVSDSILLSPNKLTPEEMAVMKQHTYHTYHLIGMIGDGLGDIQRWAAFHHERLDGSGYPFALSAADLDTESRLLAVLDVFQALTEDRPYRPPLPLEKVALILRSEAEQNHLDPDLVELVLEHAEMLINPTDE